MKQTLSDLVDRFQEKFPPNRLTALAMVVLAAPAAAAGGYLAVWVPKHFPGLPTFTPKQYTGFLITGSASAVLALITAGNNFINGCQGDERNKAIAADRAAGDAHAQHLKAMELESQERIAAITSPNPELALEQLGLPAGRDLTPPGAISDVSPPPVPPPSEIFEDAPYGAGEAPAETPAVPPPPASARDAAEETIAAAAVAPDPIPAPVVPAMVPRP